jgi:uncharacterized membrane protein YccC
MLASWGFDDRNRRMFLNEALLAFAAYLRARAGLYDRGAAALPDVIETHGALMERLQAARDAIFTGAPTAKRRKWTGGMLALLDLYETVLSSDADWEALREAPDHDALLQISALSRAMAADIEAVALALVSPAAGSPSCEHPEMLAALDAALARLAREGRQDAAAGLHPTRIKLARAMRRTRRLAEMLSAAGSATPPLPAVALSAFVQPPARWLETLRVHLTLRSPVMRYAIRLTLAMLAGYAVTVAFPRYVHGGWILLTVALIMRASYAITRQRRNDRIFGTLAGCALAAVLIPVLPQHAVVAIVIIGVGLAHAYATVNYRITSFAASLMALLLLHFLEPQTFYVADRVIDTLVGAGLSVVFARVLPSWEWHDVPRLVSALVAADRTFALQALTLAADEQPYRLARKQALDRFTVLAMTARRLSSEPHHQDRQFASLNELLAANYLFASDLASVQGMLRARAGEIDTPATSALLNDTRKRVLESLTATGTVPPPEKLRRRGWLELRDTQPLTILRRRLLHIEHSARRLAAQASRAAQNHDACNGGSRRAPTCGQCRARSDGGPAFQRLDEAGEPGVGLVAVEHAVIDGERDISHRPDEERVGTRHLAHHHALFQLAHAQDRRLRLVDDDGRGEQRPGNAVIGDGKSAALHIGAGELALARLVGERLQLPRDFVERQRLRAMDHRHHQPALAQCGADADVHLGRDFDAVLIPAAVDRRRRLHRRRARRHEISRQREVHAAAGERVLVRLAVREDGGKVRFEHRGDMRCGGERTRHVLGDLQAHAVVRDARDAVFRF